jgi:hypothetical protein
MQLAMAEPSAMQGFDTPADQVHVPQLIGIALSCACIGLGLVYALAKPTHASQATQTSMAALLADPSTPTAVLDAHAAANGAAAAAEAKHAGHRASGANERAHAIAAKRGSTPNRRLSERRVARGAIAYLRCDGLPRHRQGTACPRDRALESAVWSSLQGLAQCRNADPGSGQAELRLTLRRGATPLFDMKPWGNRPSLNFRAVSKCAGPTLTKLRTQQKTQRSIVTFRFGLN